ncbi:hypothetical protein CKAH01_09993 [Colletotrichum kahawae]|uniref:Uncharacterized protein n=1 Tax=Colletotrichum kahawae TaxID=34407 RepID=A0AAE0CZJ7_COLKA|nr:hypothetical protein CKAH01_09993 [Colletotrichum kahawae]
MGKDRPVHEAQGGSMLDRQLSSFKHASKRMLSSDTERNPLELEGGAWLRNTSGHLSKLIGMLQTSVAMWDKFTPDIDLLTYHEGDKMSSRIIDSSWKINVSFLEMRKVLGNLEELRSEIWQNYPQISEFTELAPGRQDLGRSQAPNSSCPEDDGNDQSLSGSSKKTKTLMSTSERTSAYSSRAVSRVFTDDPASAHPSSFTQHGESTAALDRDSEDKRPKTFYRYIEPGGPRNEPDDEVMSLTSSSTGASSKQDSSAESWKLRQAAASYIADMLTANAELIPMYRHAAERLEGGKFLRNHTRLLKNYYTSLRLQTPSQKQSLQEEGREQIQFADAPNEDRNLTLERFLNNVEDLGQPHTMELDDEDISTYEDEEVDTEYWSEGDEPMEEEVLDKKTTVALADLEATRDFFTSGPPLARFKIEFQNFLFPKDASEEKVVTSRTHARSWNIFNRNIFRTNVNYLLV